MKPRIRRETVGAPAPETRVRILYASDLHLGLPWTRRSAGDLVDVAISEAPDIVLLGGDLVDNRRGLDAIAGCVRAIARSRPVAAVPGNHDVAVGLQEVRHRVLSAGGAWLSDAPLFVRGARGAAVRVCGRTSDTTHAGVVNVACLHDPADAEAAASAGFDVAFAGHLHGGQCILFELQGKLYPGAWFNRWTGLRFSVGNLRLFVSLGLGDTLPLRLNCPHEVILCDVAGSLTVAAQAS